MLSPRLILASSSPRRIELLKAAGFQFVVKAPRVTEKIKPKELPRQLVERLAFEKALAVKKTISSKKSEGSVILAADTIVVTPDGKKMFGKPASSQEACKMLSQIQGSTHSVWTCYCILGKNKKTLRSVKTRVSMRKLSPEEIHRYVQTGEPMDKAGAYAAQGAGMSLIREIRGSYTNVVGLPLAQVMDDLRRFSVFNDYPFRK